MFGEFAPFVGCNPLAASLLTSTSGCSMDRRLLGRYKGVVAQRNWRGCTGCLGRWVRPTKASVAIYLTYDTLRLPLIIGTWGGDAGRTLQLSSVAFRAASVTSGNQSPVV